MNHSEELTYNTEDTDRNVAPTALLYTRYIHNGNGKVYELSAFAWDGESDKWKLVMYQVEPVISDPVAVVRPLSHLFGKRANGEKRYTAIKVIDHA